MKILFVVLFAVFIFVSTCDAGISGNDINANKLVDNLMKLIFTELQLDPYRLPDLGFNAYTVQAQLHDGTLTGLSTLRREDNVTLHLNKEYFNIELLLGTSSLKFNYKGTLAFMGFGPTVEFYGSVGYVSVKMAIDAKSTAPLALREFKINELASVEVEIKGLHLFNPIIKLTSKAFVAAFNPIIRSILESHLKGIIDEMIKSLQLSELINKILN